MYGRRIERDWSQSPIGFLRASTCNQDENHFSWILAHLLNTEPAFRAEFLDGALGIRDGHALKLEAQYQHSSVSSRPDLVVRVFAPDESVLAFVETKVTAEVDLAQLIEHARGLEAERWLLGVGANVRTTLILLAPRESLEQAPSQVKGIAWEDVHAWLVAASLSSATSLAAQFAAVLEVRGLADFGGFDTEAWRQYVELVRKNSKLFSHVQNDAKNLVEAVKKRAKKAIVDRRPPFDGFDPTFHERGRTSEFWFCPKAIAKHESHWCMLKVILDEGILEASAGTWTTKHSPSFLRAVGKAEKMLSPLGWKLWYTTAGAEDTTDLSNWEHLLNMKVTEVSVARFHDLPNDRESLSSSAIVDETMEDLRIAADFLLGLLGSAT